MRREVNDTATRMKTCVIGLNVLLKTRNILPNIEPEKYIRRVFNYTG